VVPPSRFPTPSRPRSDPTPGIAIVLAYNLQRSELFWASPLCRARRLTQDDPPGPLLGRLPSPRQKGLGRSPTHSPQSLSTPRSWAESGCPTEPIPKSFVDLGTPPNVHWFTLALPPPLIRIMLGTSVVLTLSGTEVTVNDVISFDVTLALFPSSLLGQLPSTFVLIGPPPISFLK